MQSGLLVSDELVNGIVEERLARPDAAEGFILDGYPRTLPQARHLRAWFEDRGVREVVIHLVVDYNIVIGPFDGTPAVSPVRHSVQPRSQNRPKRTICVIWMGKR